MELIGSKADQPVSLKVKDTEVKKSLTAAAKVAGSIKKVKNDSYFEFDKDYGCSNSVDRDFLQALVDKKDYPSNYSL